MRSKPRFTLLVIGLASILLIACQQRVRPSPPTVTPTATRVMDTSARCPSPETWRLENTMETEAVSLSRIEPTCAYDAILRRKAAEMLHRSGWSGREVHDLTGVWTSVVVNYNDILAGKFPPYLEWPATVPVAAIDGTLFPKSIVYNLGFAAGDNPLREWSPVTLSMAPSYCASPKTPVEIPLRGGQSRFVCAFQVLFQSAAGQPFVKQYEEHLGVAENDATTLMSYEYWFFTEEGDAYLVARSMLEEQTTLASWVKTMEKNGDIHRTGVWTFRAGHPGAPEPPPFRNGVDGWARLATLTGASIEFPSLPDGWQTATEDLDAIWEALLPPVWEALGAADQ